MKLLTGIKPTGKVHLGNYIGAIRPFKEISYDLGYFFIADYHALTNPKNSSQIKENSLHLAAALLSFFDNSSNTKIYRQSKIPQVFELYYILSCCLNKGWLNRAHAYKTIQTENIEKGKDSDLNVNVGLYTYPLLMAADILIFSPGYVPVGYDQRQHIEIMKEVTRNFNHIAKSEVLSIPETPMTKSITLCGSDGRKMSKSYGNTIEIFESEKSLKKKIFSIPTNFKNVGEAKYLGESEITNLFKIFSSREEFEILLKEMEDGIGWGEIKEKTLNIILKTFEKERLKYQEYINSPELLLDKLEENEEILRVEAETEILKIKKEIGF